MDSSASSSFASTGSSSSPSSERDQGHSDAVPRVAGHGGGKQKEEKETAEVTIKSEPITDDSYEPSVWAHIFDENGIVCLDDDDDDEPMDDTLSQSLGGSKSATPAHNVTPARARLDTPALFDPWGVDQRSSRHTALTGAYATANHSTPRRATQGLHTPSARSVAHDDEDDAKTAYPTHFLQFERKRDGRQYQLSKPILRDDGLLLVGTELPGHDTNVLNRSTSSRIFICDFRSFHSSVPTAYIHTADEVRDLQWVDKSNCAVAAIGKDIHLMRVSPTVSPPLCNLMPPFPRAHTDTIRELAVNVSSSVSIASGGFDKSVVLTILGESGDSITSTVAGTVDVHDVVSSLRWSPVDRNHLTWTTDGGDFQLVDVRTSTREQLQVQLDSFLEIDSMGGLFTHEYISEKNVVLGFQSGKMLFLDLRMPRVQACYGVMQAPIGCIGEMRRAPDGACALFGVGGFVTATVSLNGHELENLAGARPSHAANFGFGAFKTSGDFSVDSGSILAVSDNIGAVSIYNGNKVSGSTAALVGSPLDGAWQK